MATKKGKIGRTEALRFIEETQSNDKLQDQLDKAYQEGSKVTLEKIAEIGGKAGFQFTPEEFGGIMRQIIRERFAAGELQLGDLVAENDPPQSSCAYGCLSYTKTWHPPKRQSGIMLPRWEIGKV